MGVARSSNKARYNSRSLYLKLLTRRKGVNSYSVSNRRSSRQSLTLEKLIIRGAFIAAVMKTVEHYFPINCKKSTSASFIMSLTIFLKSMLPLLNLFSTRSRAFFNRSFYEDSKSMINSVSFGTRIMQNLMNNQILFYSK